MLLFKQLVINPLSGKIKDESLAGQWQRRGETIKDPQGDLATGQPSLHQSLSAGKQLLPGCISTVSGLLEWGLLFPSLSRLCLSRSESTSVKYGI